MRLDKKIWDPTCREYIRATSPLDTSYFNTAAKVFLSVWLERLTDFNAPVTRRLDRLGLLDLTDELLRAIRLWSATLATDKNASPYRVVLLLREIGKSITRSREVGLPLPGQQEASRLQSLVAPFSEFIRASNKDRDTLWPAIAATLEKGTGINGGHPDAPQLFAREIVAVATGLRAFLRGDDAYLHALTDALTSCINGTVDLARADHVVCELLAHSLRRGYSKEHLAELPVKYLRADNPKIMGKALSDRVALIRGAFRPSKQRYLVVLPLAGPLLAIDGDIFPSGIEVVAPGGWKQMLSKEDIERLKPEDAARQAFRVDVDAVLEYEGFDVNVRPHDVFAARDLAVQTVRRCLDVVFLLRSAVPSLAGFGFISAEEGGRTVFVRRLDLERDYQPEKVSLKFLRAVPAEWVDALHWYREGRDESSDEVGLVNLWTAIELLSHRDPAVYHSIVERVKETVGALATLALVDREIQYLGHEIGTCINPSSDDSHELFRAWVMDKPTDETRTALADFPHLAEAVCAAKSNNYFATRLTEIQSLVSDKLVWAYGYRNDVVHEGRRGLPGAGTARDVLADLAEAAISLTLKLESRRFATSLHECFQWARQQIRTLNEISAAGNVKDFLTRLVL